MANDKNKNAQAAQAAAVPAAPGATPAPAGDARIAELESQLAQLKDLIIHRLAGSPTGQAAPTAAGAGPAGTPAGATVERLMAEDLLKQRDERRKFQEDQQFYLLPNDLRTQVEANRLFPDGKRIFAISVGWCPRVLVRADDALVAEARYNKVCGIMYVRQDHTSERTRARTMYQLQDVTEDALARQLVVLDRAGVVAGGEVVKQAIEAYAPKLQPAV